jgi:hypothetical protein
MKGIGNSEATAHSKHPHHIHMRRSDEVFKEDGHLLLTRCRRHPIEAHIAYNANR